MKISIQSKTMQLTTALRLFIERQVARLAGKGVKVEHVSVFVESVARKKRDLHAAVARISIGLPGKQVVVEKRAANLYDAIQEVVLRSARVVRKTKERKLRDRRQPRRVDWQLGWQ